MAICGSGATWQDKRRGVTEPFCPHLRAFFPAESGNSLGQNDVNAVPGIESVGAKSDGLRVTSAVASPPVSKLASNFLCMGFFGMACAHKRVLLHHGVSIVGINDAVDILIRA